MTSDNSGKYASFDRSQRSWTRLTAALSFAGILLHLLLRYLLNYKATISFIPLLVIIIAGGIPLLYDLLSQIRKRQFGADFLAGLSIITAILMGELLVAAIIILMLSGGQALEEFATRRASSTLSALAHRMPSAAHRIAGDVTADIRVDEIRIGDRLIVLPHEICPVDGTVESGTGTMDESFLTGEPFRIRKTSGSQVISGALNEDTALTIIADRLAVDSRYARIMQVMRKAEENPPAIRRLADRLGAFYTPIAVLIALTGWLLSGQSERFLAVLVIATPCPLLLAIPISIIGSISLAAKRGIVIKKPVVLEQVGNIRTMFFDKTGTLTHGEPVVTEVVTFPGTSAEDILRFSASLEQYSKHPLAGALLKAARQKHISLQSAESVSEKPGAGLRGQVAGRRVLVTGRKKINSESAALLPSTVSGMECVVVLDDQVAGLIRFHDRPRKESKPFIKHLRPKHQVEDLIILSGDRDIEVQHLAEIVGIKDVRASLTPEQKLNIVRERTATTPTLFLGDGINDAPAMLAATVGIAFGQNSDITAEAAGAVIMEPALGKVDELLHIGKRMRRIALESAVGGMVLSAAGMLLAAFGFLPPIAGAIGQEIIDLLAVLNALRASFPGKELQDF
ncbi:MAG TPA: heavy metal translocating P-type ATPase [Bryobacteraceae bacterium]|nr:cadmium-translocating P-type ATPase [Acidobacteriaceae bacterium]